MTQAPSSPVVPPSFSRAVQSLASSLLLRPLVWVGACALLGVVLGGRCASMWQGMAREEAPLWLLLPFLLVGLALCWGFRASPFVSRAGVALVIVVCVAAHSARRLLPPRDDISRLLANPAPRDQPLREVPGRIVGVIGDYPQRSRWNVQFPLDVEKVNGSDAAGRVWVSSPFDSRLDVGDRLELRMPVRALLRPSNPGEREEFWRAVDARCWCENGPILELHLLSPGVGYPLERRIQGVRRALLARYEEMFAGDEAALAKRPFPRQNAALLTAMVWGESGLSEPLPQQTRDDFRAAGLSHLLVSSGTQVRPTVPAY